MAIAKKRKKFFDVELPSVNKKTQLMAYELKELEGRYISYDLTRILKGKNILLKLKVIVEGETVTTTPIEIKLMSSYIQKMIRKGTDYVEDSFSVEGKDGKLRIKPFLITRKKVSRAVRRALRDKAKEELTKMVKTRDYKQIFDEILRNSFQKELSLKLKKIYPLSLCEIRFIALEK